MRFLVVLVTAAAFITAGTALWAGQWTLGGCLLLGVTVALGWLRETR